MAAAGDPVTLSADVVVLGGGPAGAWAALAAAGAGVRVVLADKGHVGTSGATAAANTAVIDAQAHASVVEKAVARRLARGFGLVDPAVVERTISEAAEGLGLLERWGYGFPVDETGIRRRHTLRGPDYMQLLRRRLRREQVTLLDHSPALELLADDAGLAGVAGTGRRTGQPWRVLARSVVVATGGCAFRSGALGTRGLTGDGLLMAAGAGACLSGMEFSSQFGIAHERSSVTKNIIYQWATFSDEAGRTLEGSDVFDIVAVHRVRGPVYAVIDKAGPREREALRRGQPNIFVAFDRLGIDPFTQRFPVTLRHEGTVRGVGGLLVDDAMQTTVPGLFAAGDAASRERLVGATTGGGGPNATWAIASGRRAGLEAALSSRSAPPPGRTALPLGRMWGRADTQARTLRLVQDAVSDFVRDGDRLRAARSDLSAALGTVHAGRPGDDGRLAATSRETASMLAAARWIVEAALLRKETRGIHRRRDHPLRNASAPRRIVLSGTGAIASMLEFA